jgi:hypothetical protein
MANNSTNFSLFDVVDESGTDYSDITLTIHRIHIILHTYILPMIIFIGIIGNTVSIAVFAGGELRKLSSSVYVLAVLASDTAMLLTLLFVWLEVLGHRFNHVQGLCQTLVYLGYVGGFLSVWFVVCITVENYITICHPMKIQFMCTPSRARIVTGLLTCFALVGYIISIIAVDVVYINYHGRHVPICSPKESFQQVNTILTYVDSCLTMLLPLAIIIIMLQAITVAVIRSIRKKNMRSVKKDKTHRKPSNKSPQRRVAEMLFILSLIFVVLNGPYHVIRLRLLFISLAYPADNVTVSYSEGLIQLIFSFVYYTNFSYKFFLFLACSRNFLLWGCVSRISSSPSRQRNTHGG